MSAIEATIPKRKRRPSCLSLVICLIAFVVCWMMVGVSFNFSGQSPLQSLETARDKWDAAGINNYKMMLRFGRHHFLGELYLTIQADQIVQVAEYSWLDQKILATPISPSEANAHIQSFVRYSNSNFPIEVNDYTFDNLFNFAAEKLSSQPILPLVSWCDSNLRYETTFNDEYGYLQSLRLTNCPRLDFGGGMICSVTAHCSSGIDVIEFEPLP